MISMPQLPVMTWDWKNQLQATAVQAPADGAAQTTYYQYDSAGKRVRKATASPGGRRSPRAHLPGRLRGLPRVLAGRHAHPGTAEPAHPGRRPRSSA